MPTPVKVVLEMEIPCPEYTLGCQMTSSKKSERIRKEKWGTVFVRSHRYFPVQHSFPFSFPVQILSSFSAFLVLNMFISCSKLIVITLLIHFTSTRDLISRHSLHLLSSWHHQNFCTQVIITFCWLICFRSLLISDLKTVVIPNTTWMILEEMETTATTIDTTTEIRIGIDSRRHHRQEAFPPTTLDAKVSIFLLRFHHQRRNWLSSSWSCDTDTVSSHVRLSLRMAIKGMKCEE